MNALAHSEIFWTVKQERVMQEKFNLKNPDIIALKNCKKIVWLI
jgi:hypothetical protein